MTEQVRDASTGERYEATAKLPKAAAEKLAKREAEKADRK